MVKKKLKILMVDDEEHWIKPYSQKIEEAGFDVEIAHNGEEGLKKVADIKPDLILLDINMPVMDGLTMAKKLREKKDDTPILLLTNLSDSAKVEEALKIGLLDYIIKSDHSLDDVIKKINEIIENK